MIDRKMLNLTTTEKLRPSGVSKREAMFRRNQEVAIGSKTHNSTCIRHFCRIRPMALRLLYVRPLLTSLAGSLRVVHTSLNIIPSACLVMAWFMAALCNRAGHI